MSFKLSMNTIYKYQYKCCECIVKYIFVEKTRRYTILVSFIHRYIDSYVIFVLHWNYTNVFIKYKFVNECGLNAIFYFRLVFHISLWKGYFNWLYRWLVRPAELKSNWYCKPDILDISTTWTSMLQEFNETNKWCLNKFTLTSLGILSILSIAVNWASICLSVGLVGACPPPPLHALAGRYILCAP